MFYEKIENNTAQKGYIGIVENKIGDISLNEISTKRESYIQNIVNKVSINNIINHLYNLSKIRNPEFSIENLNNASNYIINVLNNLNLKIQVESFNFKKVRGVLFNNLLAYKFGVNKRKILIVASHYDTVKTSPGADDNASSIAALLEIARLVTSLSLEYTIQFTFFTLEEYNMIGSLYHMKSLKTSNNKNIIGAIVHDGIGYVSKEYNSQRKFRNIDYPKSNIGDFLGIISNENSASLLKLYDYNVSRFIPSLNTETLIVKGNGELVKDTRRSDNAPFWDCGYKSVLITDTCQFRNPHTHKPTDTINTLDFTFLANSTKATLAALLDICLKR